jgi:arylsulfatase A-like enzyme
VSRLRVIIWLGLIAGLAEAALLAVARFQFGRYTHLPPDLVWMSPLASVIVFAVLGAVFLGLARLIKALRSLRATLLFFSFVAFFNALLLVSQLHHIASLVLAAGFANLAAAAALRFPALFDKAVRYSVVPLVIAVIAGGGAFHMLRRSGETRRLAELPAAQRGAPNIIFIIWDTVRSTNLSLYGYGRPTTPFLDQLAAQSVVFERAASPASWTLPAHASLFTGAHPHEVEADWAAPLEAGKLTLAEYYTRRGYRSGAFVGNTYYCSEESGLHRGFIKYDDFVRSDLSQIMMGSALLRMVYAKYSLRHFLRLHEEPGRKSADRINQDVIAWLDADRERPFFVFLNYFDAHAPYLPPAPYDTLFGPPARGRNPLISEERPMSAEELRVEVDAYDGAIRYLDQRLRELFAALQRRGSLENTIVVLTSDHGEQFGEHGLINHGNSLYLPLLHVPLLIHAPGRIPAGTRVSDWVSTSDLAATIAEIASQDMRAFPGKSLTQYWKGGPDAASTRVLSEVSQASGLPQEYPASHGDMVSVISGNYQLIRNTAGTEELFDLNADPAQLRNLRTINSYRPLIEKLRRMSTDTVSRFPPDAN